MNKNSIFDQNEINQQNLIEQNSIGRLSVSQPFFTAQNNQHLYVQNFRQSQQDSKQMLIKSDLFQKRIMFNHSNQLQKLFSQNITNHPNTLEPYDIIQDVIISYENNVRTKIVRIQKISNKKINNKTKNYFSCIFRKCYFKKSQQNNKNFIKFLIPKFFEKILTMNDDNQQWKQYNKKLQNGSYSRKTLYQLFCGIDTNGFKAKNTKILYQMLIDRQFYIKSLYTSNYTKIKRNLKQYLFASKVFSLRCISRQLLSRVKTK